MHGADTRHLRLICLLILLAALGTPSAVRRAVAQMPPQMPPSTLGEERAAGGDELYAAACASCHGGVGTGADPSTVAFSEELPDFTFCSFATREPDSDWVAVAHDGGPVRGFSRMMPAFGEALSVEQIQAATEHIRSFCPDESWPRGELNFPRPLITEKAFPEDEFILESAIAVQGAGSVRNRIVYERRFGARNQIELILPFSWRRGDPPPGEPEAQGEWVGGIGDIGIAVKRALWHSLRSGSILSLTGEFILPTGSEQDGLGRGTVAFEPFLTFGQALPAGTFFQFQGGTVLPFDLDKADNVAFWRGVLGGSLSQGRWGRSWSPMVEVLARRDLVSGESTQWDLLPQFQVTLNTRQHVMMNVGVRIPLDDTEARKTEVLFYFLWEWFDGGLFDGW